MKLIKNKKTTKLLAKLLKRRKFLSFFLIIAIAYLLGQSFYLPVNSQVLSPNELGELISETEQSWEQEYEKYFDTDFVNYSKTKRQIAQQLAYLSQETGTKPAVIWAVPTEDRLYLLLITPNREPIIKVVREASNPILLKIINLLYETIYSSLTINSTAYLPPAQLLYNWLIAPLEPDLKAENIDTLMLCSGPSLRSFPFAVLHDGKHFLIEKYNLVRLPAFNLTDVSYDKTKPHKLQILAMGVSQFPDKPPLPGVEAEVSIITPKIIPGKAILNQNSTVKNLKIQHQQGKFNLIHLATHAEFNRGSASNSYIEFADRKLRLNKIEQLNLAYPPVDLLVLSACQTALGNKQAEFGFAGLFLRLGVKSSLASLWQIDDLATVMLMSEFYQNLKSNSLKTEALRQAQVAMIRGKVNFSATELRDFAETRSILPAITQAKLKNYSHPFYWAGFSLIGNPW